MCFANEVLSLNERVSRNDDNERNKCGKKERKEEEFFFLL